MDDAVSPARWINLRLRGGLVDKILLRRANDRQDNTLSPRVGIGHKSWLPGVLAYDLKLQLKIEGPIGFDGARWNRRSGPRRRGHLVNAPREQISAKSNSTGFALAA